MLKLLLNGLILVDICDAAPTFTTNVISTTAMQATSVFAIDMDKDGDIDVLSTSYDDDRIVWYENNGVGGFTSHDISTTANGAERVFAIDVDDDGDIDVLSASYIDDTIAWYENDGYLSFTKRVISSSVNGARSVFAIDLDNDGDVDVLSASYGDGHIRWFENNGLESFTSHTIYNRPNSVLDVFAIDMDIDGDIDVLSASSLTNGLLWHQNDGSENFADHTILSSEVGSVFAIDLDGDGDIDVLSTSYDSNNVLWHENDGAQAFTSHTIQSGATGAYSVYAADIDGDGDIDVVAAIRDLNSVVWYENNGAQVFTAHTITPSATGVRSVYAADIDGDSHMDILAAIYDTNSIVWYRNIPSTTTDVPTTSPTQHPSLSPSAVGVTNSPTVSPTTSPTLAPTLPSTLPETQVWVGGTFDPVVGVLHTFSGLDTSLPQYLSVRVMPTDMDAPGEYVNITVNGIDLGICFPDTSCDDVFYSCFIGTDVSALVDTNGDLAVFVFGTDAISTTLCPYNGLNLYVEYSLAFQREPTSAPTSIYSSMCAPAEDCFHDANDDQGVYQKCDMCVCDDFGTNDPYYDDDEDSCGGNEDLFNCFIKVEGRVRYCKLEMKTAWIIGFVFIGIFCCCGSIGLCVFCCRNCQSGQSKADGTANVFKEDVFTSSSNSSGIVHNPIDYGNTA